MVPPVHMLPGVTVETEGRPSGPFTEVSNLPLGSGICARFRFKGSPAHVSALSSPAQARYPASYTRTIREEFPVLRPRFPAAFRLPAFASWAPCPAREFSPPYGRLTAPPAHTRAWDADP